MLHAVRSTSRPRQEPGIVEDAHIQLLTKVGVGVEASRWFAAKRLDAVLQSLQAVRPEQAEMRVEVGLCGVVVDDERAVQLVVGLVEGVRIPVQ